MYHLFRSALWLGFFFLILLSWWVIYSMSLNMDLDLMGRPGKMGVQMAAMDPRMPMHMPMANFGPLFLMWAIMMAAMMLPTMVPTLRSYEDLIISATGTRIGWIGVTLGYLLVWVSFAAAISGVQLALLYGGEIDMLGVLKNNIFAGILLIIVGLFQFSRTKEVCHGVCHNPTVYFLGHWRDGFMGGSRMGIGLGIFCVGCCWGFMFLGFVGGVMNLLWMGLATLFMVLEKLPQFGRTVTKPMGLLLIGGGLTVLIWPFVDGV